MKLLWTDQGWAQYREWPAADPALVKRINALLEDCLRSPFLGIGKPEPLRGELSGWWSRRITEGHRLIYRCIGQGADQRIEVAQCRDHYLIHGNATCEKGDPSWGRPSRLAQDRS